MRYNSFWEEPPFSAPKATPCSPRQDASVKKFQEVVVVYMKIKTIGIIGGRGKMGSWFANFFAKEGIEVFISDVKKEKLPKRLKNPRINFFQDNKELVKKVDFILISVLFKDFLKVVKEISPLVKKEQKILDILSIKEKPVEIMHSFFKKNITLGTHPLFGPKTKSTRHNFLLTPTNKKERDFAKDFKEWLEKRNFRVKILSPKEHDEFMTEILGFPHFVALVSGSTILDFDKERLMKVLGPSFKKLLSLIKNVAFSSPEFYSDLHFHLPKIEKIEKKFEENVKKWNLIIKRKDKERFIQEMLKIRDFFQKNVG